MRKMTLAVLWIAVTLGAGCADSRKPITVALTPATAQAIDQGQSLTINAALTNDSGGKGVMWSSTGTGTLSNQTSSSVIFNAPAPGAAVAKRVTPDVASSATATVTATSVANSMDTGALMITVTPPPSLTTTSLPDAVEGTAYSQSLAAEGGAGNLTYLLNTGNLPAGLAINSSTGAITGTPTATGTATFTVKVMDSSTAGAVSANSGSLSIKVDAATPPAITTTSLAGGTVGTAYSQTVSATGGLAPLAFSISVGSLPAGLTINSATGTISGTPTAAGTAMFTVKVTDATAPTAQTATKQLSITISPAFAITTSTLPNGTVGTAYSQQLQSAAGTAPVTWSLQTGSALPAGLSISSAGLISGTPTAVGTSNFTVKAVDSSAVPQTALQALSITIAASTAGLCDPSNTGSEALLNGQYAMVLQGFNSTGAVLVGATFDADGAGHIAKTVGIEDVNTNSGQTGTYDVAIDPTQSSYSLGADHRGCLIIATAQGVEHFAFAAMASMAGVATRAQVIETTFLGNLTSGTLLKQDASAFANAKLNGSYAFGVSSAQGNLSRYAAIGVFNLDGAGTVTGQMDVNERGNLNGNGSTFPSSAITISSGNYSVAPTGRGTLSFTPSGGSAINTVVYVVNAGSFLILRSDTQGTETTQLFYGDATLQSGKPYSGSSIGGTAVFGTKGTMTSPAGTTDIRVGQLFTTGVQHSITYVENPGGTSGTVPSTTIPVTYAVDPSGRVVASNSGTGGLVIFYLSAANQGYLLFMVNVITNSADTTTSSGFFLPQTGSPYTDPTFGGVRWSFGSLGGDSQGSTHTEGWADFAANPVALGGIVNGREDFTNGPGNVSGTDVAYSQRVFVTPASGAIQWTDATLDTLSVGYFVSPTKILAIDSVTSSFPALLFYEVQ